MYANLRGLDRRTMEASINSLVDALLLRPHVDKLVKSYRCVTFLALTDVNLNGLESENRLWQWLELILRMIV